MAPALDLQERGAVIYFFAFLLICPVISEAFFSWTWKAHRVNYGLIARLERECFPEWFQAEWPQGSPAFIDNSPGAIIPMGASELTYSRALARSYQTEMERR